MAEMKEETLETQINSLIVAEDMELVDHQVVIKNEMKDEEDLKDEVKEETEPHQTVETRAEIKVEIPPDSTPVYCSNCGQNFTEESQIERHKCFVLQENAGSDVQSKKAPLSKDPPPSVTVRKTNRCPICKKKFQWESVMQKHMLFHTKTDNCKLCWKAFKNKPDYQRHLLIHKKNEPPTSNVSKKRGSSKAFLCALCEVGFDQEKSLIRHQKYVHRACSICLKQFRNMTSLSNHKRSHYRADGALDYCPKPFICSCCKESFALQTVLIKHRETSHNIGPFICSECGKHLISMEKLWWHKLHHFQGNRHKCSECNEGFNTQQKLKAHMKTHKKSFVCSVCEKTFYQEHSLTKHMESHVEEKPFKCSLCEKSFVSQRELLHHQRMSHHMCPLCSERFSDRDQVNKHFNSHPWPEVEAYQRPFQCSECGFRLASPSDFLKHQMTVHSKETPVECPVCQKRFNKKVYLISHQKREHGGPRPFDCTLCKKRLKTKQGLICHMNAHNRHRLATENQDESTPSTSENCVSGE